MKPDKTINLGPQLVISDHSFQSVYNKLEHTDLFLFGSVTHFFNTLTQMLSLHFQ